MTGDGILHRCWIVLILPCGTFHTVGYVKLWKDGMTGPVLFVFPKETSVLIGKRVLTEITPFQHINAWLQTVFFGRFYVSPQISLKHGEISSISRCICTVQGKGRALSFDLLCFQRKLLEISFGNIKKFPEVRKPNFWKCIFISHQNFLYVHFYTRLYP